MLGAHDMTACKYDLTDFGHTVAGTGILDFSCSSVRAILSSYPA